MRTKKRLYTSQLPPALVTDEMYANACDVAKEKGISLSELQRQALSLFLGSDYAKTLVDYAKSGDRAN